MPQGSTWLLQPQTYAAKRVMHSVGEKKRGSLASNLIGWSEHKVLSGQGVVGSRAPGVQLFSKRFMFALRKSCPLFPCTWVNTPLIQTRTAWKRAHNLVKDPIIQPLPRFLLPPGSLLCVRSLVSNTGKKLHNSYCPEHLRSCTLAYVISLAQRNS